MILTAPRHLTAKDALLDVLSRGRVRKRRTMAQFATEELRIPGDGEHAGERFNLDRQPFARVLLNEIDSARWRIIAIIACVQSGKTLLGLNLPTMYHLFELGETFILGAPDMATANDKWEKDILPMIESSRYREMLPTRGEGARGGKIKNAVTFANGTTLRILTAGRKHQAGYTARAAAVTEVDKMDEARLDGRETDPVRQIEARTMSFGPRRRIYLECTASIEEGRIWQAYQSGSCSRLVVPCPHCQAWVLPTREHLAGWQDAETEIDAEDAGHFRCPACGDVIDDDQRAAANRQLRIVHDGQAIDARGRVTGEPKRTRTLGFRWEAFHNLFWRAADIAGREWLTARDTNPELSERSLLQEVWATPATPTVRAMANLNVTTIAGRIRTIPRGCVPRGTIALVAAVDCGKWQCHWAIVAFIQDGDAIAPHVVDYGVIDPPADHMPEDEAVLTALRELRDKTLTAPLAIEDRDTTTTPTTFVVDESYLTPTVYRFIAESGGPENGWYACQGQGAGQRRTAAYARPPRRSSNIVRVGEEYHMARLAKASVANETAGTSRLRYHLVANADHWKSWVHARIETKLDDRGAMTLYEPQEGPRRHFGFARHMLAEEAKEEADPRKGLIIRWYHKGGPNHWLDVMMMSGVAGHIAGAFTNAHGDNDSEYARRVRRRNRPMTAAEWSGTGSEAAP